MENHSIDSSRSVVGTPHAQMNKSKSRSMNQQLTNFNSKIFQTSLNMAMSRWFQLLGMMQYSASFMAPYWKAAKYFSQIEAKGANGSSPWNSPGEFLELLLFELQLATTGTMSGMKAMSQYHSREMTRALTAMISLFRDGKADDLVGFSERQLELMETVADAYPKAIREIESEYGFHFDNGGYVKMAETDRFELYQVLPTDKKVKVRNDGKPVLVIPPFVLGANILAFLPGQNKSYVHAFANRGIPTYIRVVKDIATNPAVQLMTGEDDARDTRHFSEL
ncbi:MAG: hypothetical protein AAGU11_16130, partial [Syntrophobacteraceae bacterium]